MGKYSLSFTVSTVSTVSTERRSNVRCCCCACLLVLSKPLACRARALGIRCCVGHSVLRWAFVVAVSIHCRESLLRWLPSSLSQDYALVVVAFVVVAFGVAALVVVVDVVDVDVVDVDVVKVIKAVNRLLSRTHSLTPKRDEDDAQ